MLRENKHKLSFAGDYVPEKEAFIDKERDLRHRCKTALEIIEEGRLPVEKVLKGYKVSINQLVGYLLMENKKVKLNVPEDQLFTMMASVALLVNTALFKLDNRKKEILQEVEALGKVKI